VGGHADAGAAVGALLPKTRNLAVLVDRVELEHSELDLHVLVGGALGLGVHLLLPLLAPTTQAEHQVEGGLLLDVVVAESAAIFQLLAGEDQTLLIRGDALLVLDLGLDVVDGVGRLDLKGDGLAGKGFDEDLRARRSAWSDWRCRQRMDPQHNRHLRHGIAVPVLRSYPAERTLEGARDAAAAWTRQLSFP
jgi:hypothetical protein